MAEHPLPEMLRLSLQDLALRIKTMRFEGSIEEVLLSALDPPTATNIQRAISSLIEVRLFSSL
jgi:ATP-dependent RNA helicase DHX29